MGLFRSAVQDRLTVPARVRLPPGVEEAFRALRRSIPAPIPARLLIDTGSKRSSMVPLILDRLAPTIAGRATVETSFTSAQTELHWVRLEFPGSSLAAVPELAVARLPLPPSLHDFHGVVGRDLLGIWESFHYQGRRRRLTIRDTPPWLFGWFRHA
jgi:hypothetical protein